jgi:hypothetical protein
MNQRADPRAAHDANTRQLKRDLSNPIPSLQTGEVRTTYSISESARHALQLLAVEQNCKLNDLVALAIEDFLATHGSHPVAQSRHPLRARLRKTEVPTD